MWRNKETQNWKKEKENENETIFIYTHNYFQIEASSSTMGKWKIGLRKKQILEKVWQQSKQRMY